MNDIADPNFLDPILHNVIHYNDEETFDLVMQKKEVNINILNAEKETPLHFACYLSRVHFVKKLLEHPDVDITLKSEEEKTVIDYLGRQDIQQGRSQDNNAIAHIQILTFFLSTGKVTDSHPLYPEIKKKLEEKFITACEKGFIDTANYFLSIDHDIAKSEELKLAGLIAVAKGNWHYVDNNAKNPIIKPILKSIVDINKVPKNEEFFNALISSGNSELFCELFNKSNSSLNIPDKEGNTWLHRAVNERNEAIVKYLLNCANIDKTIKNALGETPFLLACRKNNVAIAEMLLDENQDSHFCDNDGNNALMKACQMSHGAMIQFLLKNFTFDLNSVNDKNKTVVDLILMSRGEVRKINHLYYPELEFILQEALISKQKIALLNKQFNQGNTLLHWAVGSHNHKEKKSQWLELLLSFPEIDIAIKNDEGKTAFLSACESGDSVATQLFLNKVAISEKEIAEGFLIACQKRQDETAQFLLDRSWKNEPIFLNACDQAVLSLLEQNNQKMLDIVLKKVASYSQSKKELVIFPQQDDTFNLLKKYFQKTYDEPFIDACKIGNAVLAGNYHYGVREHISGLRYNYFNTLYLGLKQACHDNRSEVVDFILKQMPDGFGLGDEDENNPLIFIAIDNNNVELFEKIKEKFNIDINVCFRDGFYGETILSYALKRKYNTSRDELLTKILSYDNLDINNIGGNNHSALRIACQYANPVMMNYLSKKFGDSFFREIQKELDHSCENKIANIDFLLAHGAILSQEHAKSSPAPFAEYLREQYSAQKDKVLREWLEAINKEDISALDSLIRMHEKTLSAHIEHQYTIERQRKTAFQIAAEKGNTRIISRMLFLFSESDRPNLEGEYSDEVKSVIQWYKIRQLFDACEKGDVQKFTRFLSEESIDLNQQYKGKTLIQVAWEKGDVNLFGQLLRTQRVDADVLFEPDANQFFKQPIENKLPLLRKILVLQPYVPISRKEFSPESAAYRALNKFYDMGSHFDQTEIRDNLQAVLHYFEGKFKIVEEMKNSSNSQWKVGLSHLERNWKNFIPFLKLNQKGNELAPINEDIIQRADWRSTEYKQKIRVLSGRSYHYNQCSLKALMPLISQKKALEDKFDAWKRECEMQSQEGSNSNLVVWLFDKVRQPVIRPEFLNPRTSGNNEAKEKDYELESLRKSSMGANN